jgi:transposase InsO family protein
MSFVDDCISFAWVTFLHAKSSAVTVLQYFLAMIKTQFGMSIKEWISDAGGEYKSDQFLLVLKKNGIKVLQSAPHTPQQNGCTECFNRTIMDKAEAMWHEACLPDSWWEFAVEHAMHLYNCTPMECLNWRTPSEKMHNGMPDILHPRVFGYGAYAFVPPDIQTNKLAPKSELMVYLGVAEGLKAHHFMHSNGCLFYSTRAVFDEELYPKCTTQKC